MSNLLGNFKRGINIIGLGLKKHAPEIMVVAGSAGAVAGAVMACKATLKLEDTLQECKEDISEIETRYATEEEYSEKQHRKDITVQTVKNAVKVGKLYAPAIGMEALSLSLIFGANGIHRRRNASMAAAYATIDSMFKRYRKNVVDTYGEDADYDMRYNVKHEILEEEIIDENGKKKKVKTQVDVINMEDPSSYSDFSRFFDESCPNWDKDPEYNMTFLKAAQSYCNSLLKAQGYLFLNDVYKQLGLEPSRAGQVVGWIYDKDNPVGDNYVDFGLYESRRERVRAFVNGSENVILLDFNVDGDILNNPLLKLYRR